MFGCTMTLCKWKIETTGKTSSVYVNVIRGTELDRESMILCAVMSGGDYLPAGISKCGIKTVLEAVNVGLGRDLYQLCKIDKDGIKEWRDRLARELLINTSNFFTQKHKTLSVFYKFPDMTVLELYRHPFVFTAEAIAATNINWDFKINVVELSCFVRENFGWNSLNPKTLKLLKGVMKFEAVHRYFVCQNASSRSEWFKKKFKDTEVVILSENGHLFDSIFENSNDSFAAEKSVRIIVLNVPFISFNQYINFIRLIEYEHDFNMGDEDTTHCEFNEARLSRKKKFEENSKEQGSVTYKKFFVYQSPLILYNSPFF